MLDLDIIKPHCRIEQDITDDDALLDTYSNAARRMVESLTGRTLYTTLAEVPKDGEGNITDCHYLLLDDDITTAMLLLIGHWYVNREAVVVGTSATQLPLGVQALVTPYRHYHF